MFIDRVEIQANVPMPSHAHVRQGATSSRISPASLPVMKKGSERARERDLKEYEGRLRKVGVSKRLEGLALVHTCSSKPPMLDCVHANGADGSGGTGVLPPKVGLATVDASVDSNALTPSGIDAAAAESEGAAMEAEETVVGDDCTRSGKPGRLVSAQSIAASELVVLAGAAGAPDLCASTKPPGGSFTAAGMAASTARERCILQSRWTAPSVFPDKLDVVKELLSGKQAMYLSWPLRFPSRFPGSRVVEGGKTVGRFFTATMVSTVSTCDRVMLGEARAPGPDIGKGFVDPALAAAMGGDLSRGGNVEGACVARGTLCGPSAFQATYSSLTQLVPPEYPHQHFMRVDEETDRTALGGSKTLRAGKQGLNQPYKTEVRNLLLVILATREDIDHPEVKVWWYALTRSSIEVLRSETLARKQAGATLAVGEGKRGPPVSTQSGDVEYVGAPSPVCLRQAVELGCRMSARSWQLVDEVDPIPQNLKLCSDVQSRSTSQNLQFCMAEGLDAEESRVLHGKIE
ncbi:hypothetical protein B0H14DRAFT_2568441 [Mycena olivaceomarginata]|nr:hypothetical protein B0H14DRAFT_2568441 [Mycena olivaceomarginata]